MSSGRALLVACRVCVLSCGFSFPVSFRRRQSGCASASSHLLASPRPGDTRIECAVLPSASHRHSALRLGLDSPSPGAWGPIRFRRDARCEGSGPEDPAARRRRSCRAGAAGDDAWPRSRWTRPTNVTESLALAPRQQRGREELRRRGEKAAHRASV